ncbi:adenosine receptor A3-like [Anneissia japonica]|uniref:adenosine receptor A3-like n=1 Tax=Anneissia japonica TaxID=1529436 RepID=UPI001425835F|nr:adenosine receptor A3-like [Anneissia japonica]
MTYEYDCGVSAVGIYGDPAIKYLFLPFSGLTMLIMFMVYAYIYLIASKKGKENALRLGKKIRRREMKVTKTTAIVLISFTLCITPTVLKGTVIAYINSSTWIMIYRWFSALFLFANSMMNPLIYAGRSKEMRKEFKETFELIVCKVSSGSVKADSDTKAPTRRQSPKVDLVTTSLTNLATRFGRHLETQATQWRN